MINGKVLIAERCFAVFLENSPGIYDGENVSFISFPRNDTSGPHETRPKGQARRVSTIMISSCVLGVLVP